MNVRRICQIDFGLVVVQVICCLFVSLLHPTQALADVPYPMLLAYVGTGPVTMLITVIGFCIECYAVSAMTGWAYKRCLWPTLAMNLASSLIGVPFVPVISPGVSASGHVITYIEIWQGYAILALIASFADLLIEGAVLAWFFKVPVNRRNIVLLFLANLTTVELIFSGIVGDLYLHRMAQIHG